MNKKGRLEYISDSLRNWHVKNGRMKINDKTTNMKSFGFDIKIENGYAIFEKVRQSEAKYKDGLHRSWQGQRKFTLKIKGLK